MLFDLDALGIKEQHGRGAENAVGLLQGPEFRVIGIGHIDLQADEVRQCVDNVFITEGGFLHTHAVNAPIRIVIKKYGLLLSFCHSHLAIEIFESMDGDERHFPGVRTRSVDGVVDTGPLK